MWKSTSTWHYVNIDPQPDFKAFKENLEAQAGYTMYTQIKTLSEQIKNKTHLIKTENCFNVPYSHRW